MKHEDVEILKVYADHDMNAAQKGRFVTVCTHTGGGDIRENFRPGEVMA